MRPSRNMFDLLRARKHGVDLESLLSTMATVKGLFVGQTNKFLKRVSRHGGGSGSVRMSGLHVYNPFSDVEYLTLLTLFIC